MALLLPVGYGCLIHVHWFPIYRRRRRRRRIRRRKRNSRGISKDLKRKGREGENQTHGIIQRNEKERRGGHTKRLPPTFNGLNV